MFGKPFFLKPDVAFLSQEFYLKLAKNRQINNISCENNAISGSSKGVLQNIKKTSLKPPL